VVEIIPIPVPQKRTQFRLTPTGSFFILKKKGGAHAFLRALRAGFYIAVFWLRTSRQSSRKNADKCGQIQAAYGHMRTQYRRMRANTDMKNDTSDNTTPARIEDVLAAYEELALSPIDAEILRALKFWKRRVITEFMNDNPYLRHVSRSTIKLRLRELIRAGRVRRHGKGKATWYTL
jgi:hypothetical protein